MADVDLHAAVRRVLVKNWLDMGKVKIQIAGGTIILRGTVTKGREGDTPVDGLFIEELETQIRGVKGVKFVRWMIEGWKYDRGKWVGGDE